MSNTILIGNSVNRTLKELVNSKAFDYAITALILINAVTIGLETSEYMHQQIGPILTVLDSTILGLFILEMLLRIVVSRWNFFRDPWRVFDLVIILVSLVPVSGYFTVLRMFRILRTLRLFSTVGSLRSVVSGLLRAVPGMGSITLLLVFIFYIFSVMATNLFGSDFPEWFGTVGLSAYSLFQIMTLESWSMGIVRPVMDLHPYAWAFFVPFIMVTSFAVMNLFVGVIVEAMANTNEKPEDSTARELRLIRKEIEKLKMR